MLLNDARQRVYDSFEAAWATGPGQLRTPYVFDNENGPDGAEVWTRCSVRSMPGGQSTLGAPGNRKFHRNGLIRVEVYVPPAKGLGPADDLLEAAAVAFEARSLGGLRTYDAEKAEVGLVDEDRWFLSTIEVAFDYEEIK